MDRDRLSTRRVYLRPLAPDDASALFEAIESSRDQLRRRLRWVTDATGLESSRAFIEAAARSGRSRVWGVFENKNDRLLGVASLDDMVDPKRARAHLGMWVVAERQDKGLGTEVGRAVLEYGFKKLSLHRVFVRIDPANRAFRRVLKKLGFRYEGCLRSDQRLNGRWVDQECWGLLKSEFKR
jgi:ribosomal-protein-serine acetyltransferase